MDVVLFAATTSLTAYLPRRFIFAGGAKPSVGQRFVVAVSLWLSLALFSLSLLELVPGSWMLWIKVQPDDETSSADATLGDHHRTIAGLYRWILWSTAVLCTTLIPCATGTQLILARNTREMDPLDEDDHKKRSFTSNIELHWSVRFLCKLVSLAFILLWKALCCVMAPIGRALRSCSIGRKYKMQLPVVNVRGERLLIGCYSRMNPIVRFLRDPAFRRSIVVGSIGGTALTWGLLFFVGPFVIEPSNNHSTLPLLRAVSWLCAVGIFLSALLNGFGSISLPYSCLAGLFLAPVPPEAIANAEIQLEKTKATLKVRIKEMESGVATLPSGGPQSHRTIWRKVQLNFSDIGDEVSRRRMKLITDIEFMETLIDEMSEDVEEMRYSQALSAQSRTAAGRVRSWVGVFFSVVLLNRLLSAISSVCNQYTSGIALYRNVGVDPVTQILLLLSGHHVVDKVDLHTLSQFISLLITAFLSFSQVRTFLRTAATVQRRVTNFYRRCYCKPRCSRAATCQRPLTSTYAESGKQSLTSENSEGDYDWFFAQLVSALMCCYCLACIVLTKMMLPFEFRSSFSRALCVGAEDNSLFTIRTYAVDVAFSAAAVVSGAILAMLFGIMRSNARRYGAGNNASATETRLSSYIIPQKTEP